MENIEELKVEKIWGDINPRLKLNHFELWEQQKPVFRETRDSILRGESGLIFATTAFGKTIVAVRAAGAVCIRNIRVTDSLGNTTTRTGRGLYIYDENFGLVQALNKFKQAFPKNLQVVPFFGKQDESIVEGAHMVVASYQSMRKFSKHGRWYKNFSRYHFDFIIVNEAHESMAPKYREVLDYFLCPQIGMTATKNRTDKQDIMQKYKKLICNHPIEEAIMKGWICHVEYHLMAHNLSKEILEEMSSEFVEGKRINLKHLNERIFISRMDKEIVKIIKEYANPIDGNSRQVKIFCESTDHADEFAKSLPADKTAVIHSKKSDNHNDEALRNFRNKKVQFLLSVDKINQDIDVPEIEVVVFLRATASEIVFWQQLGRGTRKHQNKEKLIVLDFVGNIERIILLKEVFDKINSFNPKGDTKPRESSLPFDGKLFMSGVGFDFIFSDLCIENLLSLIQRTQRNYYQTWQEASESVIRLGIKTSREYEKEKKFLLDPKLPPKPTREYKSFPGWDVFFGRLVPLRKQKPPVGYYTFQEAKIIARTMGIKDSRDYLERHHEDPRLPPSPDKEYKDDFTGFPSFLGTGKDHVFRRNAIRKSRDGFYQTYSEASYAARQKGINTSIEYRTEKKYLLDSKLPPNPQEFYGDNFVSWPDFLGSGFRSRKKTEDFYLTWQEAARAAIAVGMKERGDYRDKKKYLLDPKLPSDPAYQYKGLFPGWPEFFEFGFKNL